uniref:RNase H type-1 domain-containing protein n=1 Tax=Opuntia streptacantha TaxID=393608 RepID=A0A7C8ZI67_OPUST
MPFNQPATSLRDELHTMAQNKSPWLSRVVLLLWSLWKSRNAYVFKNEVPSPMGTLVRAKRNWAEWTLRNRMATAFHYNSHNSPQVVPHHTQPLQFIGWKLPQGGFVKLNFDGTKSAAVAAAGFVLRNWQGSFITAGARFWKMLRSSLLRPRLCAMALVLRCELGIVELKWKETT